MDSPQIKIHPAKSFTGKFSKARGNQNPAHKNNSNAEHKAKSVRDAPRRCIRAAGLLRYNRESDHHRLNSAILPEPPLDYQVKCEYCKGEARPSLNQAQAVKVFCCAKRKHLCEMLVKQKCLVQESWPTENEESVELEEFTATTELEELFFQGREMEDPMKFFMDLSQRLGQMSEDEIEEDDLPDVPKAESPPAKPNLLKFRLSCAPANECWTLGPNVAKENGFEEDENQQESYFPCEHEPLQFGMCYHQDEAKVLEKKYSSGKKFLTLFPDGSAQVYYPSGVLALVLAVTKENGRVFIVFDDRKDASPQMRALFQSDGKATCYHTNGKIWLSLDRAGGQCLDETGSRLRHWKWTSDSPTPLFPVFLSLNKTIGVRVLGQEQVFVSFLAGGQQAKFRVGTCCAQCTRLDPIGPSLLREERFVLRARIKINQTIQRLHNSLMSTSNFQPQKTSMKPPSMPPVLSKGSGSQR